MLTVASGKSDPLDADRIAAAVLPLDTIQLRRPCSDEGIRAALRVLTTACDQMTTERTAYINALTALLRAVNLDTDARKPLTTTQISEVAAWRTRTEELAISVARAEVRRLAKRVHVLGEEIVENMAQITTLIESSKAAPLLDKIGIGPVTVAIVSTAEAIGGSSEPCTWPQSPA